MLVSTPHLPSRRQGKHLLKLLCFVFKSWVICTADTSGSSARDPEGTRISLAQVLRAGIDESGNLGLRITSQPAHIRARKTCAKKVNKSSKK